jgi:hypothetical protein
MAKQGFHILKPVFRILRDVIAAVFPPVAFDHGNRVKNVQGNPTRHQRGN